METFEWVESDRESFVWAENCVPPRATASREDCYLVLMGEPIAYSGEGAVLYNAHCEVSGSRRYFKGSRPVTRSEFTTLAGPVLP